MGTVSILGQGYVGLSLACAAASVGMRVSGIDVDAARVAALGRGELVVPGVRDDAFVDAVRTGRLAFTTDPSVIARSDVVVICVPTPVDEHRPDLSMVQAAGRTVGAHLRADTLVILESTTYPGTTERFLQPLLEAGGMKAGIHFQLAYSPERIDPGNEQYDFASVPRVVGGIDEESTQAARAFYAAIVNEVHVVSSCRAAEMAKLLENTYRMVNIALVNELAVLCDRQAIDVWEVIDAAATKPFGFQAFYPGPGVGGHCIPVDPTYLSWQSRRDTGRPFRLVELAQDTNAEMPGWVAMRIADALNARGRALNGSVILGLGVTYKPDVGDVRESAPIHVLEHLHAKGATIRFHDPFIDRIDTGKLQIERVAYEEAAFEEVDCVALLTPHRTYDLDQLIARSPLLFDARNATAGRSCANVVVL